MIQEGYKIPFIEIPPVAYLRNNKSALRHKDFVQVISFRVTAIQ
jgi:hypothetical protein